jgi:dephospho-CoA kinase
MPVLGITGGAACGKSSFTRLLSAFFEGAIVFSADEEVARLAASDACVRAEILQILPGAYSATGAYDRANVRRAVFENPDLRTSLNAILHPRVRETWSQLAEKSKNNENWLLAEIPLLYETAGDALCDRVITVGCTVQTQLHRLTALRGLSLTVAEQIRGAQSSLEEKSTRADHFIWNDCPFNCLNRQAALCASWLKTHFA